jgi:nucleotide-binding universal stress UspA family protein
VCLDRSAFSEVCLLYAISLTKTFGSAVTLAYVMEARHERTGPQASDALGWEIARQEAKGYLERLEKEVSQALGQPVEVRLEQGRPAERIVDLAREIEAEITVLGSRGEGCAPASSLGRTAQQILASAHNSVFIAHSSSVAPAAAAPKRILVPLDGSIRTESVLPAAVRIASAHGAELLLVHVVQETLQTELLSAPEDMALAHTLTDRLESGAKRYLERLQRQLEHRLAPNRTLVVRHANERQCLLEISQREQADLIVISAHGYGCDSARSFGSVTTYLLTHSTVPLLVLQDLPGHDSPQANEVDGVHLTPPLRASYAPEHV